MTDSEIRQLQEAISEAIADAFERQNNRLVEMVERHQKTLHGNGNEKDGLVFIVTQHCKFINAVEKILSTVLQALAVIVVVGVIILLVQNGLFTP